MNLTNLKHLFFDLDGTIINPYQGISKSIIYALRKLEEPDPSEDWLRSCIGPSLRQSFKDQLEGSGKSEELALKYYREYFSVEGMFENTVYIGIPELLESLSKNYKLHVVTAKPGVYAKEIIKSLGYNKYFQNVFGPELDGTYDQKTDLLEFVIKKLEIEKKEAIMIGDREHDIIAGRNNNILTLGITYGFGYKQELENAKADLVLNSPSEILKLFT